MDLYETCSDDGRKSLILAEKLICVVCGKVKSCYNVPCTKPRSQEDSQPEQRFSEAEGRSELICQCEDETCYEWLKRLVGFGPEKAQVSDENGDFVGPRFASKDNSVCQSEGKAGDRSSKPILEDIRELQSVSDTPSYNPEPASVRSKGLREAHIDVEGKADAEEQSQTSRESKSKKRKSKGSPHRKFKRSDSGSDAALSRRRIRDALRESSSIPVSTATVFQNYRSRIHYSFQLDKRKKFTFPERPTKTQRICSENKQQSASIEEGCPILEIAQVAAESTDASSNPESLTLGFNCSACVQEPHVVETRGEIPDLKRALWCELYSVRRCFSNPETDREHQEVTSDPTMARSMGGSSAARSLLLHGPSNRRRVSRMCGQAPRSSSLPGKKSQSFSGDRKTIRPTALINLNASTPYPIVLSCASPTLRGRKRWDPTPKTRPKPSSCPCVCACSPQTSSGPTSSLLRAKLYGSSSSPERSRTGRKCRVNCMGPCCLPVPRPERKVTRSPRSLSQPRSCSPAGAGQSKWRTSCSKAAAKTKKAATMSEKKKRAKDQKDSARLSEIFQRYDFAEMPPRSCPPMCVGRPVSVPPGQRGGSYNTRRFSTSSSGGAGSRCRPMYSPGGRPTYGLNFTQSSNSGRSPETAVCSRCQNVIEFNRAASEKTCKCEFVLKPHCIRRRGPRSTVAEYLYTIEHPKPRPRVKPLSSAQIIAPPPNGPPVAQSSTASASQKQRKSQDSSASVSKFSGKAGKKKKGKDAKTDPSGQPEQAASDPGTHTEASAPPAAGDKGTNNPIASSSQQKVKPAAIDDGKRDGNNNYGLDAPAPSRPYSARIVRRGEHSSYSSPRYSSVPAQSYTSYLDTGYSRAAPSPYFASNGMRTAYGGSTSSYSQSSPSTLGYLRAAQDFRRNIRTYYEQKRLYSGATESAPTYNDVNLNAWHSTAAPCHPRLAQRPDSTSKTLAYRQSGETLDVEQYMQATSTMDLPPTKKLPEGTRVISPRLRNGLPSYTPRKSFVDGATPIEAMYQDFVSPISTLDVNTSKAQLVERTANGGETRTDICVSENRELLVQENGGETCHGDSQGLETHNVATKEEVKQTIDCKCEIPKAETLGEDPLSEQEAMSFGKVTETKLKRQYSAILNGKESSVDNEPQPAEGQLVLHSTVRKIEPRGTLLKMIVPESTSSVVPDQTPTETTPVPATTRSLVTRPTTKSLTSMNNTSLPVPNLCQAPADNAAQVPVFQSLMERFSESVQIFVRTKEDGKEASPTDKTVQYDAGSAEKGHPAATTATVTADAAPGPETTAAYPKNTSPAVLEKKRLVRSEAVAAWGTDNKSRNKMAPSCEATSDCVSWSELVNPPPGMQPPPSGSVTAKTAKAVSSSATVATVAPVHSGAALKAAGGGDLSGRDYKLEVEICTTTERLYVEKNLGRDSVRGLEKTAQDLKASVKQVVSRNEKAIKDIVNDLKADSPMDLGELSSSHGSMTYVINAAPKVCLSEKEMGQGENPASRLDVAPCPRKSCSEAKPKPRLSFFRRVTGDRDTVGSSVDPAPVRRSPGASESILDAIRSNQPLFQKVNDGCDATMIMSAKSRFLRRVKGESLTNVSHCAATGLTSKARGESMTDIPSKSTADAAVDAGPFSAMVCRSFDSAARAEQTAPIRIGSLTEAMKKFISDNGTPV